MFGARPHLAIQRRYGIVSDGAAEQPVPIEDDAKALYAQALGARVESAINQANVGRAQKQLANAAYQKKHGSERNIVEGDYVFITNNGATQETKFENKQLQSGPFRVASLDAVNRRAALVRMADNTELERPVSLNRLQRVDKSSVLNPSAPTFEPGVMQWSGAADIKLLLGTERTAADKALVKVAVKAAAAAAEKRATDTERQRLDGHHHAVQQQEGERRRTDNRKRADEKRHVRQLELDRATVTVPSTAVVVNILHHASGTLLSLAPSVEEIGDLSKRLFINRQHPEFNHYEAQWRRATQGPQPRRVGSRS